LGWSGDLGYSFRIHGKEFNSFRGRPRSKPLREFRLHRQEKFLCICDLRWTCGSGISVSWTFRKARRPKTQILFAWAVVALRLRRVAVGPEAIG
jgi:hypothetical protein